MGKRTNWLSKVADRVPTKWFATAATVVFLAVTAAFGGLADKPVAPLPTLTAGETHHGTLFDITVDRIVVIDEMPELGMRPEAGKRVLGVVLTATNRWTDPVPAFGSSLAKSVEIDAMPGVAASEIARMDDQTRGPWLQPDVPVQLAMLWTIDEDLATGGEPLTLRLLDGTLWKGSFILSGYSWTDFTTAAYVEAAVKDNGTGEGEDAQ